MGGGIFGGSPHIVDNLIENNTAEAGGGISTYFGVIENNVIKGNSVVWYGGGVWCNGYDPLIIGNEIVGNTAGGRGAGISMQEGSTPTILNNLIIGNYGGGIYLEESGPDIANNVIADNLGYGVKLYWNEGARITNSIIWGNDEGSNIISEKSIHSRGITYNDIQGGWPEEGNIDADPLFVARGEGSEPWLDADYHLLPSSPCIDTGDPNYMADPNETDLDGKPRVIGGRIDMGAYEAPIFAEARILPRTINLASKGKSITCYISLPEDYNVADIDPNSVLLENEIKAESLRVDEQQQVAIAKFNRSDVQDILNVGDVELTISGQLTDGTIFEATDVIRVLNKAGRKPPK